MIKLITLIEQFMHDELDNTADRINSLYGSGNDLKLLILLEIVLLMQWVGIK